MYELPTAIRISSFHREQKNPADNISACGYNNNRKNDTLQLQVVADVSYLA